MTDQRESVRGIVDAVFYSGPTFSAGRLVTADGGEVKFAARCVSASMTHSGSRAAG
jgi:hypothetical protein